MKKKNKAFTLAEVLITLAIIGVVAAITIPALMNNVQDTQYKTAYKKAFSVASQAWQQCVTDNELVSRSTWYDNTSNTTNFLAFKSKFKVIVDCTDNDAFKCWVNNPKETYWGTPVNEAYAFIDNSGMAWSRAGNGDGYGDNLFVDTNGNKGPNQWGKDRFVLAPLVLNAPDGNTPGIPTKLAPNPDYPNVDTNRCPSGGCYYTSWLTQ